jgi:hypothetical protein
MRPRRVTAAQLKDRRNKKIAVALAVVFVAVCVVQVPKLMKQLSPPKPSPPAQSASSSTPAASGTSTPATPVTSNGSLPTASPARLDAFGLLPLKDPFHSPIQTAPASSTAAPPTPAKQAKKPTLSPRCAIVLNSSTEALVCTKKPLKKSAKKAANGQTASGTVQFKATGPPPNAAVVKTNGTRQVVFVGDGFPTADPLFKLVALGNKTIRIGVFGGSFTTGEPTIRLAKGKPVTLDNQADGSHYVIQLVKLTTATEPAPTQTTPASTTPASTTPATTTTP